MGFRQSDLVRYYTFESFDDEKVTHAFFTRCGGVSPSPWESLNLGGTVGDDIHRVAENRRRACQAIQVEPATLYDVWQVHSSDVVIADNPRPFHVPHSKADAILTDKLHLALLMRFADCVPILLYDPAHHVIGIVHAGWQGTVKQVVNSTVYTLCDQYGSQTEDVLAAIGPSIGPDHYEVGPNVIREVERAFGPDASGLLHSQNGVVKLDLWSANRLLLERAGVRHIEVAGICTACHLEDWYSHRGEQGKTGRFGVMISLSKST
jgi:YfiH family protein